MTIEEAVEARHSVRKYRDEPIPEEARAVLEAGIAEADRESGLHIQLVCDRPEAFASFLARYGGFSGVRHYLALVGPKGPGLEEKLGYYGERLVLLAQTLGLGTCWIGGTFSRRKTAYEAAPGEKLGLIISVGVPAEDGRAHRSKGYADVTKDAGSAPDWFRNGARAALLAPTAVNQQRFTLEYIAPDRVRASAGRGPFTRVDLGIVKYHFEVSSGKGNFIWTE